jgi:hypothetical protein
MGGGNAGGGSSQSSGLFGGQTPPPAPKTEAATVPPQWMRPDGTVKTPEEIANEVAGTLKAGQGPDIGKLAGDQFGGQGKSAVQLAAEAAQINNIRNDIAVGENDPYKVASQSGIAYTAQELQAIEKAYAGIYDPAITTALAKVEQKQAEDAAAAEAKARQDEMRLGAELDAQAPYTLGQDQIRYGADGKPIAMGLSSSVGVEGGTYAPGANPTVDAYINGIRDGVYKPSDVPDQYKSLVAQGISSAPSGGTAENKYVKSQADTALTNIDTALGYLEGTNGQMINTADNAFQRSLFGFVPGTDAKNLNETLNTVKALIGFDALQKMREASPTGGALGNITEKELGYLQSVQGSLDTGQGTEQLVATLKRIQESFETLQIVNSPDGTVFELGGQNYVKFGEEMIPEAQASMQMSQGGNRPQRNNNPLNIKASEVTSAYPGVVGTDPSPATDGGQFLIFNSPQAGFEAAKRLLQNPNYQNLSVDAAMRRWSNNGYGAEIVPSFGGKSMATLTSAEMDALVQAMAQIEGYYA